MKHDEKPAGVDVDDTLAAMLDDLSSVSLERYRPTIAALRATLDDAQVG